MWVLTLWWSCELRASAMAMKVQPWRLGLCGGQEMSMGVHRLGWVWLRGFFDPTHHGGSKKIQFNPTQPKFLFLLLLN